MLSLSEEAFYQKPKLSDKVVIASTVDGSKDEDVVLSVPFERRGGWYNDDDDSGIK